MYERGFDLERRRRLPLAAFALVWTACSSAPPGVPVNGLLPANGGLIVDDSNQNVHWLADADLAGSETFGVAGINRSGSMTYETALLWVAAMDADDGGVGYLGHNNWQLPTTPPNDTTCPFIGASGNSIGPGCTGSALGSLYTQGLALTWPAPVAQVTSNTVGPFQNLQPGVYWSAMDGGVNGLLTFSFSNGQSGANISANFMYVLPMIPHAVGTPPAGTGLLTYLDGKAVYDSSTGFTWLADADLAASNPFGITGTTSNGLVLIAPDGAMKIATAMNWIAAMNAANYLGQGDWQLPSSSDDLATLFADLGFQPGDSVLTTHTSTGPFKNIQPDLYWTCQRDQDGGSTSPCTADLPAPEYGWSFTFGSGFQGTTHDSKYLYVMVYYPFR
jgi:hypothetical protein